MKRILVVIPILLLMILFISSCAHTHEFGTWKTVKNASCMENGMQERLCSCGEKQTQIIPAKGHHFGEWNTVKNASCTDSGEQERTCSCGEKQVQTVPMLGHTIVIDEKINPTCTQTGLTEGSHCSVCHEIIVEQKIIEKNNHIIEIIESQSATCTQAGLSEGQKCSICGEIIQTQIKTSEPLGHDYGEAVITKHVDCEHNGESVKTCKRCGKKETDIITATGHSWKSATCSSKRTCTVCGKTDGDFADHNYSKTTTEATCTQKGKNIYTCTVCGYSYEEVISEIGHKWTNATCTVPKTCSTCGTTDGNSLGHNYVDGKCSRCGESEGNWSVYRYVDEFKMETNDKYIATVVSGTFSNSATTDSLLDVIIAADKEKTQHIDFYFLLFTYGNYLVKQTYGTGYYDVVMRTSNGEKYTFTAYMLEGGDRLLLDDEYEPLLMASLLSGGTTYFYIVDQDFTTTNYLFSVESSNFASALKELTE